MNNSTRGSITTKNLFKFILPSLLGIILFMVPIRYNGDITIPVALLAGLVQNILGNSLPYLMTAIIFITAVGSILSKVKLFTFIIKNPFLNTLLNVSYTWVIVRVFGSILAIMTLFQIGPEAIWSEYTGGLLLFDLIPVLFSVFLFAGLFLPLLLNFGLLELCGALLTKIMRPLFRLPGRSSIDCLTSWLGDGTIGVLLTNKQYEDGFYSKREAAVIGTTFSVVSITFTIVILAHLELQHMFGILQLLLPVL